MHHYYFLVLYSENIQSQWFFTYSPPSVSTLVFHLYRNVSSKHGSSREGPDNRPILITSVIQMMYSLKDKLGLESRGD